jgi:thiol:disulfide interchange protein DsbC
MFSRVLSVRLFSRISFMISMFVASVFVQAAEVDTNNVVAKLKKAMPQIEVASVAESSIPGLYEVAVVGNGIIYMSEDGNHFVAGDMYRLEDQGVTNVTEKKQEGQRAELIGQLDEKEMIIFPASGKEKAEITVFTDIDCGFCRQLHAEVKQYNDLGITVRYMAYPRAGYGSNSYNKYVSVWCADDQNAMMTKAKQRQQVPAKKCQNPIQKQYLTGQALGVNSTPNIFLESGQLIRGYVPARELAVQLGLN